MRRQVVIQIQREAWSSIIDMHINEELPELSKRRRYKARNTLEIFARWVKKHPNDVTRADIEGFLDSLVQRGLKPWTIRDYKIFLKRFYRKRKGKKFVEWIKIPTNLTSDLGPEDLISEEEFSKMISMCENLRDKALISTLLESDFRPDEFLSLKRKNVRFDKYGALLHIEKGKTGPRTVRIVVHYPLLAEWLENHPLKENGAPVWVNLSTSGKYAALRQVGLRRTVKKIAKSAGITKRIWPYLFRHTRNTQLSTSLTESPFCGYAGWQIGSRMPAHYVHLSGKNVDDAILKMHGIIPDEKKAKLPVQCPRCSHVNAPEQQMCTKCGMALSLEAAMREDEKRDEQTKSLRDDMVRLNRKIDELKKRFKKA